MMGSLKLHVVLNDGENTPEWFRAFVRNEISKWGVAAKTSGATLV